MSSCDPSFCWVRRECMLTGLTMFRNRRPSIKRARLDCHVRLAQHNRLRTEGAAEWRFSSSHEEPGDLTEVLYRRFLLMLTFFGRVQYLIVWWPQGQPGVCSKINRKNQPRNSLRLRKIIISINPENSMSWHYRSVL